MNEKNNEFDHLYDVNLDSVRYDNDIDQDREKTRDQLGFKDTEKRIISERMAAARQMANERLFLKDALLIRFLHQYNKSPHQT